MWRDHSDFALRVLEERPDSGALSVVFHRHDLLHETRRGNSVVVLVEEVLCVPALLYLCIADSAPMPFRLFLFTLEVGLVS